MKAMILAAGEGRRMRPLTLTTPKPLLKIKGKPLIQYHIEKLKALGIIDIVINIAYLGDAIRDALGDGDQFGVHIRYSEESEPLETGGAILKALPLLGDQPFVLVNGDVWTNHPLSFLRSMSGSDKLGHLVLVGNPEHHLEGDFSIVEGMLVERGSHIEAFTYSGVGLIHPDLIRSYPQKRQKFPLVEAFRWAMQRSMMTAELYRGEWTDVGTPERLRALQ